MNPKAQLASYSQRILREFFCSMRPTPDLSSDTKPMDLPPTPQRLLLKEPINSTQSRAPVLASTDSLSLVLIGYLAQITRLLLGRLAHHGFVCTPLLFPQGRARTIQEVPTDQPKVTTRLGNFVKDAGIATNINTANMKLNATIVKKSILVYNL
jgi:hypothetical protein